MKKHILLGQLASQAWAMHPEHLANLSGVLHRWSAGEAASADVMADVHAAQAARTARKATPTNATGNIAVLNLWGVMSQKANLVEEASGGGGTSTQAFLGAFRDSMADPSVAAILIDCDSPGGSVTGTPELTAEVMKARGVKPVYAFVNGLAASACYWVASACEAIYSTPSGSTGSIGVYCAHTDASKAMEKAGLAQEFISAGKYKTEGASNGPLNPDARAFIQSQIDTFYAMFTSDVARGRGTTPAAVRNGFGQGRCLLADEALRAGLVDGVCSFEQVVGKLAARVKGASGAATGPGRNGATGLPATVSANAQKRERELAVLAGGAQVDADEVKRRAAQRQREIRLAAL
jgi:signal peptide peptidase SppA